MNERIKELAKEAGAYFGEGSTDYFGDYLPPYMSITKLDLEKFAELVVRECANTIKKDMELAHIQLVPLDFKMYANNRLKRTIKEYFGVAE